MTETICRKNLIAENVWIYYPKKTKEPSASY